MIEYIDDTNNLNTSINYRDVEIKEGINLHLLKTNKFKTTKIKVYVQEQLRKESAPMLALTSYILFRGTENKPTTLEMMRYLEKLYGADLSTDAEKYGECQYLTLGVEIINKNYLPGDEDLLGQGLALVLDILANARTEGGQELFYEDYFNQEKIVLKDEIKSIFNDKSRYASKRCTELMCPDEPFGTYKYGSIGYLENITNKELYNYYQNLLENNPIHIFVVGNINDDAVIKKVENTFDYFEPRSNQIKPVVVENKDIAPQTVIEEADVQQGKLIMGYRTNITRRSPLYPAMIVFNGIFGALPHSKLFQNVREKSGLAYYISTGLDSTKGIIKVTAGIDSGKFDETLKIIKEQFEAMKAGQISQEELEFTIKAYRRSLNYLMDNNDALINSSILEITNDLKPSFGALITAIEKVTIEDIQKAANMVELDTVYFLKSRSE